MNLGQRSFRPTPSRRIGEGPPADATSPRGFRTSRSEQQGSGDRKGASDQRSTPGSARPSASRLLEKARGARSTPCRSRSLREALSPWIGKGHAGSQAARCWADTDRDGDFGAPSSRPRQVSYSTDHKGVMHTAGLLAVIGFPLRPCQVSRRRRRGERPALHQRGSDDPEPIDGPDQPVHHRHSTSDRCDPDRSEVWDRWGSGGRSDGASWSRRQEDGRGP